MSKSKNNGDDEPKKFPSRDEMTRMKLKARKLSKTIGKEAADKKVVNDYLYPNGKGTIKK